MPQLDVLRHRTQALFRSLLSHRVQLYSFISFAAVSTVILNALRNFSNLYSVAIYLSKSGRSVLVLANFALLVALFCGHITQRIFFGSLRANEVERLYDRLWFFITESLLAFTIFRDEFDISFVLMFGFLLFVKSFHWLASDRIEWMDQQPYPGPPALFHLRMTSLFIIFWLTDFIMFIVAIDHTITYGVGGMVLFASEYGILMASIMNTISKYLLSAYELRRAGRRGGENAPPWENKSMWVFYIELATDFLKLTTYLVFFIIIITFYGLPLNIIRDVYITARSFITRLRALHRYQTATRNMDQRYPNATEAELAAMSDRTCIICREDMALPAQVQPPLNDGPNVTPKKLPCGHIFHFYCLRSWLERQQSCPTCRQTVLETDPPQRPANVPAPGAPQQGNPQQGNPQQGNNPPEVQPANNNAAINNPLGNPLGLLGRLLGQPGQGINRNPIGPPRALPNANANANPGQNNPVVIEYHIQYQVPRLPGAAQNGTQNPPPVLQPIQPFQGFQGPNGVWQRWPINQGNDVPIETPNNTTPETSETTAGVTLPATESQDSNGAEDSENARAAAALAALRRLDGSGPSTKSRPARTRPNAGTSDSHVNATTMSAPRAPRLIPLYDYTTPQLQRGNLDASQMQGTYHPNPTVPPQGTPSLSQLPQRITDAQLALMDQLTRDAIDERLRVIQNVSETLYRCVEELLRLRSVLPVTNTPNGDSHQPHQPNGPGESSGTNSSSDTSSSAGDEGKGKGIDGNPKREPAQVDSASSTTVPGNSSHEENGSKGFPE